MDKEKILKKILKEEVVLSALSVDALKLYLLFLAFAEGEGGIIDYRTIKRAFGESFDFKRLKDVCASLAASGLVAIEFKAVKDKNHILENGYINFNIDYRLIDI